MTLMIDARFWTPDGPKNVRAPATTATCTKEGCGNKGIELPFLDDGSDVTCICGTTLRKAYPMPDGFKKALAIAGISLEV